MTRFPSIARKTTPRRPPAYRPQPEALEGRQLLNAGDLDPSFGLADYVLTSGNSATMPRLAPGLSELIRG